MLEKMSFGSIRADIEQNKEKKEIYQIIKAESNWPIRDSSLYNIGSSFSKTLPKEYVDYLDKKIYTTIDEYGEAFKSYIETTLSSHENKKRTAVEFGGQGSEFFQGFSKGFFNKTVGVCLDDVRSLSEKNRDEKAGHFLVFGDLLDTSHKYMYQEIVMDLQAHKTDLIVSRMMAPVISLAKNPLIFEHVIRKWYSMLNQNGLIFAQFEFFRQHFPNTQSKYEDEITPPAITQLEKDAQRWVDEITKKFGDTIEIQLGRGVMRLHKKVGAPEELPKSKELFAA